MLISKSCLHWPMGGGGYTKLWCIHMNFNTIVFHCISNYGIYSIRESRKQYCIMNNKRI